MAGDFVGLLGWIPGCSALLAARVAGGILSRDAGSTESARRPRCVTALVVNCLKARSATAKRCSRADRKLTDMKRHANDASAIWFSADAPGDWTERAACRQHSTLADFFTDATTFEQADLGLTICAECPVQRACLSYGRTLRADGVWGGRLLRDGAVQHRMPREVQALIPRSDLMG